MVKSNAVKRAVGPFREHPTAISEPPPLAGRSEDEVGYVLVAGGIPVEVNRTTLRLHSLPLDQAAAAVVPIVRHWQESKPLCSLVAPGRDPVSRDYEWRAGSGGEGVWLRAFSVPGRHAGRPAREIWLFDITASKAEERETERRLDGMARAQRCTRTANWEWDLESGACHWSEELFRIYGQSRESFVPGPYNEACLHPDDVSVLRESLNLCIASCEPSTFEYRIRRPTGEERTIEVHVNAITSASGRAEVLVGAINDVTRDKIVQGQIENEKGRAERASRAKSEFMANMSHELRTPLNAIIGFSEVMRREMFGSLGDERYQDYAASILESGNHLLGLINDILDLSKVEAGKYRLREEEIDVLEAIEQSINTITVALDSKGLELVRELPPGLPPLLADKRVVQQILLNLLSNAVKFTSEGGVTVAAAHDPTGDLIIAVRDTGIGMAEKDIARSFEPFEQIESSAALTHEGTGIGLALTKRLLEAHGGILTLTSKLNAGTTVEVRFPASRLIG